MREMKTTDIDWIPEMPVTWDEAPNKVLMKKKKVIIPIYDGEDILSLTMDGVIVRDLEAGGKMPTSFDGYQKIESGNLLMCLFDYDVTPRCIGIIKQNGVTSPAYSQYVLSDIADANYYYYYYLMVDNTKELLHLAKNMRHSFSEEDFGRIKAPIPPIDEQKRIAAYLDSKCSEIDALTADIQSQIDTLEQYKRSVITEAVTKGLNRDVEMKESGIEWAEQIPAHWRTMHNKYLMHKVKEICPIYNGEDILSLTMQGVIVRDFELGGKMPASFDGYQIIHPGNLLMCLFDYDVTPRCIGYINNEGLTSPAYSQFVMEPIADAHYYYYYYLMLDFTKELLHLAKNLRHSFTEDQLGEINTVVPPVNEQREIAGYLDKKVAIIDEAISLKNDQLSTLDAYKKSIIYEYVTGKKEVPSV